MPKIQILNETQVQHFYNLIEPKLSKEFNAYVETKEKEAKNNSALFMSHEKVVELKNQRQVNLDKIEKAVEALNLITNLNATYSLSLKLDEVRYSENYLAKAKEYIADKVKFLKEFNKGTEKMLNEAAYRLAYTDAKIHQLYQRRLEMQNLLKARLCMVAVADADTIENKMLQEIKVDSFFTV